MPVRLSGLLERTITFEGGDRLGGAHGNSPNVLFPVDFKSHFEFEDGLYLATFILNPQSLGKSSTSGYLI